MNKNATLKRRVEDAKTASLVDLLHVAKDAFHMRPQALGPLFGLGDARKTGAGKHVRGRLGDQGIHHFFAGS